MKMKILVFCPLLILVVTRRNPYEEVYELSAGSAREHAQKMFNK